MGEVMTYRKLERSRAFAAYLQEGLGTEGRSRGPDDANLLQYPVALFGILRAGMIVVNVNPYIPRANWSISSTTAARRRSS